MAAYEWNAQPFSLMANRNLRAAHIGNQRLFRSELIEKLEDVADRRGQYHEIRRLRPGRIDDIQPQRPFRYFRLIDTGDANSRKRALQSQGQ